MWFGVIHVRLISSFKVKFKPRIKRLYQQVWRWSKREVCAEGCLVSSVAQSMKANVHCPVQTQHKGVFADFALWIYTHTSWGPSLWVGHRGVYDNDWKKWLAEDGGSKAWLWDCFLLSLWLENQFCNDCLSVETQANFNWNCLKVT